MKDVTPKTTNATLPTFTPMTTEGTTTDGGASDLDELLRLNPAMTRLQARTYMMVEAVLEQNGVPASLSWDGCKYVADYLAEVEAENRAYGEQQRREGRIEELEALLPRAEEALYASTIALRIRDRLAEAKRER